MLTLGELFQRSRDKKGLTLAEAAYQTRIREHYLEALESNQLEKLPSAVQGKGYLRIYAQFLDLDVKTLLDAWNHPENLVVEIVETKSKITTIDKTPEESEQAPKESDAFSTLESTEDSSEENEEIEIEKDLEIIEDQQEIISPEEKIVHGRNRKDKNIPEELVSISKTPLSNEIFKTIGSELQDQRNQLNLSLTEIEQFTSIRTHYLNALENGSLEKLPSIPQAKGMLNNYATFLNLDVEKVMGDFAEGLQTRRNENYAPHKLGSDNQLAYQSPEIKKVGWHKFITMDLLLTSVLIIGLFMFILWGAANLSGLTENTQEMDAPSISEILLENTPESTDTIDLELVETQTSEQINPNSNVQDSTNDETNEEDQNAELGPQLSGQPVQVYIIARQRAYLRVEVDGEVVFTGRTVPGNAYEYSGSSSVELLTGNAAALEIFYNLNPIGVIGNVGEVKSLLFTTTTGLITPTPSFSPSPVITLQPSPTLQPTSTPTIPTPTPSPTVTQLIP
ncbi:MAG TPA: RodZ domain-containing protein [Anaerolineaceae bacterium]|nr:RodZ domain-containing protein [Anaerolineaceae bacterium]